MRAGRGARARGAGGRLGARGLGVAGRRYPALAPQPKPQNAITVAVSSRALFNLVEEQKIYEEHGLEKYVEYQQNNENVILKPGPAFYFVKVAGRRPGVGGPAGEGRERGVGCDGVRRMLRGQISVRRGARSLLQWR